MWKSLSTKISLKSFDIVKKSKIQNKDMFDIGYWIKNFLKIYIGYLKNFILLINKLKDKKYYGF